MIDDELINAGKTWDTLSGTESVDTDLMKLSPETIKILLEVSGLLETTDDNYGSA